ncbi:MAG: hypothetical protein Q7U85_08620 [Rhodocyclaceae bacterium]|nr:hypothetical protein [Rhodocyclaceae bacterium]
MPDSREAVRETSRQQPLAAEPGAAPPFLVRRMLEAQQRERRQITAELVKIKGLMPLLMKRRNGVNWSSGERRELLQQLRALAHLSPYLVVLVLPGSFLALPALAWWLDRRRQHRDDSPGRQGA